jgi:hypothetical protein
MFLISDVRSLSACCNIAGEISTTVACENLPDFSNAQGISPVPAAQSSNRPAEALANSHVSLSRV